VNGNRHLWRQRFPNGAPEQITFGATEEEGIAITPDGRFLITSIGMRQSAIWLHDTQGEHPLSMEGDAWQPSFSGDGNRIYYLMRRDSPAAATELWVADLRTGRSETVLPGIAIDTYDISS